MKKKVLLLDLDNTIYPVAPYGDHIFTSFMQMIMDSGEQDDALEDIKKEIMRRGFLVVAEKFSFSKQLTEKGNELFKKLRYNGPIQAFEDYRIVKDLPHDKYLVTAGYKNFQQDKIDLLSLNSDFKEVHIVDASTTSMTKKEVFANILERHHYDPSEVLIIGDDIESEIKAGKELGIDAVLFDKQELNKDTDYSPVITDYRQLQPLLGL